MARYTTSARCVLACMLISAIASTAAADSGDVAATGESSPSCTAMYANADRPLLFGGVHGGCTGSSCQPRQDEWSELCDPAKQPPPFRGHAMCQAQQTTAVLQRLQLESDSATMAGFTPCMLYSVLKGRTLWVMGDSIMRNYYFALRCFMLDFWDHAQGECMTNPNIRGQRAIYRAADTNITSTKGSRTITDMPKCIHLLGGGRICWIQSVRGEEYAANNEQNPGLLQVLQHDEAQPDDIFYLNFGRWHYTNCHGLQDGPYRQSLNELGSLYQRTKAKFPNVIYKTISADHSACRSSPSLLKDNCLPLGQGSYSPAVAKNMVKVAEEILDRYGVPVLETYNVTKDTHLGHILLPNGGVQDCTHYCSPGVPEWEIWKMYKTLLRIGVRPLTSQAAVQGHPACVPVTDIRPPTGWSFFWDEVNLKNKSRYAGITLQSRQMQPAIDDVPLAY